MPDSILERDRKAAEDARRDLFCEVLLRTGRARLRVEGASMVPGLWPGDVVEVARTSPASPIQSGELVLVARAGRLFCHRVVEIVRDREVDLLRTRGDALEDCDPLTPLSDVLGVVVRVERHRLRTCRWRLAEFTQRVRRLAAVLNR